MQIMAPEGQQTSSPLIFHQCSDAEQQWVRSGQGQSSPAFADTNKSSGSYMWATQDVNALMCLNVIIVTIVVMQM